MDAARDELVRRIVSSRCFHIGFWTLLVLFLAAIVTGVRLPWLREDWTWDLRAYLLFPALLTSLAWLFYVAKAPSGKTAHRSVMDNIEGRWNRTSQALWGIAALILCPAFLAWTSFVFPAWAAHLSAREPWFETYRITAIEARSDALFRSRYYEAYLVKVNAKGEAVVPLEADLVDGRKLATGQVIRARGRSGFFGVIVVDVSTRVQDCRE